MELTLNMTPIDQIQAFLATPLSSSHPEMTVGVFVALIIGIILLGYLIDGGNKK